MNISKFLMVSIVAAGIALGSNPSSAAVVDYSGDNIAMGNVALGQTGTIDADNVGGLILNSISGTLPSHSMITFTYNFAGNLIAGMMASGGEYSYNKGGDVFAGTTFSMQPVTTEFSLGTVNGSASAAFAFASAQIDFTGNTATAIITNESAGLLDYASVFTGLVIGNQDLNIAYSVSAVPLPAALPLFGLGLAAFAGYSVRKRKKEAV